MPVSIHYVHVVWSTKNRYPFLNTPKIRALVWAHIRTANREKGIFVDHVNGFRDHCHCLISVNPTQSIAKLVNQIKGESSHWINRQNFFPDRFEWQTHYYSVSVSPDILQRTRRYISNQEQHHDGKDFIDRYQELVREFGFQNFDTDTC